MATAMEKQLREKLFSDREQQISHAPYGEEFAFYELVQKGDVGSLREALAATPIYREEGLGKLSQNPVRNILFHVIISVAMISRYCIEGGMNTETAYSLSDLYIQRADLCRTKEELGDLHREMTLDFASRMRRLKKENIYSKHVVVCMEYIYEHLHEKISVKTLAGVTGLHENYLSRLFRQETGTTVQKYIQDKKLEQAEYLLKHTDADIAKIASDLSFSSQSYFIQVFKRKNGKTPKEYRNFYFRKNMKNDFRI